MFFFSISTPIDRFHTQKWCTLSGESHDTLASKKRSQEFGVIPCVREPFLPTACWRVCGCAAACACMFLSVSKQHTWIFPKRKRKDAWPTLIRMLFFSTICNATSLACTHLSFLCAMIFCLFYFF